MQKIVISLMFLMLIPSMVLASDVIQSTDNDQSQVEVTVYNSNMGLIKDVRSLKLPVATGELRFMDVAASIIPETVHVKSLNHPNDLSILEQNYEYDLMNEQKLLDKYVGKTLKIQNWNPYQDKKDIVDAKLLSNNNGPIYEINNEIYLGYTGTKILPSLPENLIAKPTLMWMYENTAKDAHQLEVSYLTNNITWKADYIVVLNQDDTSGNLSGWVTIDNKSGAAYKDASLKLVAGEVNRVEQQNDLEFGLMKRSGVRLEAKTSQFEEQGFFEYHIYDLQRKTTIKDNQTKQINLLEANNAKVQKELLTYGQSYYFTGLYRDQDMKQPVNVYVKFKNSKENNLGMPLPAGIMRLYKEDKDKKLQFIGEDSIKHTPKDEEVKLKIGEAFDVVVERKQTDYKVISNRVFETEWEVKLRNHKDQDVTVGVVEPLIGDWDVVQESQPHVKVDAFTVRFDVNVPKDKEVVLKYRIRVTY